MRLIISCVENASVEIPDKNIKRTIGKGLLVYLGISKYDSLADLDLEKITSKLINTKFFHNDNTGKIELSLTDIDDQILLISNFTLYGKNKKGTKLDFSDSAKFEQAKTIYDKFVKLLSERISTKTGEFGEYMIVKSQNNGPLNYVMEF